MPEEQAQTQTLEQLMSKIAISPEQHKQILESPEEMTKAFLDLLSVAVYTCWKEVDKWVVERSQTVVPLQFAAMVIELTNPKMHGREPELLRAIIQAKSNKPNADFLHLIQDAFKLMEGEPDAG